MLTTIVVVTLAVIIVVFAVAIWIDARGMRAE